MGWFHCQGSNVGINCLMCILIKFVYLNSNVLQNLLQNATIIFIDQ